MCVCVVVIWKCWWSLGCITSQLTVWVVIYELMLSDDDSWILVTSHCFDLRLRRHQSNVLHKGHATDAEYEKKRKLT